MKRLVLLLIGFLLVGATLPACTQNNNEDQKKQDGADWKKGDLSKKSPERKW